jgi:hypothetical protein
MNIKSLLLGSAAALVAVSGARAADAVEVVAEPEPMEYVRICDTYGTGFYYIPGTETCLKVGGYIRYDIGVGAGGYGGHIDVIDKLDWAANPAALNAATTKHNDTYYKRARAALQLDARSETELGTLRGYMHINFDYDTGVYTGSTFALGAVGGLTDTADAFGINHAYIELGGFRIGKTDSLFSTFTDYAGGVIEDDLVGYGPFGTHQIAYTFDAGNGFTAAIALEEGSGLSYTIDSYVPHVVAGVGYTAGWGSIKAVGAYDSVYEEFSGKARLDIKASDALSLFVMGGYKTYDDNLFWAPGSDRGNYYGTWGGNWAVWGGATYQASEKAAINVQLSYDDFENFAAVANVAYTVVPGFTVTPEIAYTDNFGVSGGGEVGGFLRFQRNF